MKVPRRSLLEDLVRLRSRRLRGGNRRPVSGGRRGFVVDTGPECPRESFVDDGLAPSPCRLDSVDGSD